MERSSALRGSRAPNTHDPAGGYDRIRTYGTFRSTRFPSVRHRPLGHVSMNGQTTRHDQANGPTSVVAEGFEPTQPKHLIYSQARLSNCAAPPRRSPPSRGSNPGPCRAPSPDREETIRSYDPRRPAPGPPAESSQRMEATVLRSVPCVVAGVGIEPTCHAL